MKQATTKLDDVWDVRCSCGHLGKDHDTSKGSTGLTSEGSPEGHCAVCYCNQFSNTPATTGVLFYQDLAVGDIFKLEGDATKYQKMSDTAMVDSKAVRLIASPLAPVKRLSALTRFDAPQSPTTGVHTATPWRGYHDNFCEARITELEAALRAFVDAETNENYGYATKADAIMRAVLIARAALSEIEGREK